MLELYNHLSPCYDLFRTRTTPYPVVTITLGHSRSRGLSKTINKLIKSKNIIIDTVYSNVTGPLASVRDSSGLGAHWLGSMYGVIWGEQGTKTLHSSVAWWTWWVVSFNTWDTGVICLYKLTLRTFQREVFSSHSKSYSSEPYLDTLSPFHS